ncbi:MAG: hypothetical protein ABJ327_03465 [Litoreibacter sp.]
MPDGNLGIAPIEAMKVTAGIEKEPKNRNRKYIEKPISHTWGEMGFVADVEHRNKII